MGEAFSGRVASISSFIHDRINMTLKRQENVLSIEFLISEIQYWWDRLPSAIKELYAVGMIIFGFAVLGCICVYKKKRTLCKICKITLK